MMDISALLPSIDQTNSVLEARNNSGRRVHLQGHIAAQDFYHKYSVFSRPVINPNARRKQHVGTLSHQHDRIEALKKLGNTISFQSLSLTMLGHLLQAARTSDRNYCVVIVLLPNNRVRGQKCRHRRTHLQFLPYSHHQQEVEDVEDVRIGSFLGSKLYTKPFRQFSNRRMRMDQKPRFQGFFYLDELTQKHDRYSN
ncbi:hypothetical protein BT69DRAFT_1324868 [Atractiella rhizophila]|nr:hypothetical protein BT69DRAFT_1324868 [Atractiella rhizophila]